MTAAEILEALEIDALSEFDYWVIDLIKSQQAEILRLQNLVELLELEKQMMQKASDKSKATAIGVIKRLDAEIARLTNERATAEPTDGK